MQFTFFLVYNLTENKISSFGANLVVTLKVQLLISLCNLSFLLHAGNPEHGLTYFWITDSCPTTVRDVMHNPPFEVLSLAGSIATTLQM